MTFKKTVRISFGQADYAGILFFPRFFEICHNTYEDFVTHLGFEWQYFYNNPDFVVPFRAAHGEYFHPVRGGEEYEIHLQIEKLGESSFTHVYTFMQNNLEHAKISLTSVFSDRHKMSKISIPLKIKQKLEEFKN